MYATRQEKDSKTQWPKPARDAKAEGPGIEAAPLRSASLPPRPVSASPLMAAFTEKTIEAAFEHLDWLAETVPGRNAITATIRQLACNQKRAISACASRICPSAKVEREVMLEIDDANARNIASREDVFAIHFATGGSLREVLDQIKAECPGKQLEPAQMASLIDKFSGKGLSEDTGLIQTLSNLTGIKGSNLQAICLTAIQDEAENPDEDPVGRIAKRMIAELARGDAVELRSLTIEAITNVLCKDRNDFESMREQVTGQYDIEFGKMYNPKPHEILRPLLVEAVKNIGRAGVFLVDSAITENLPHDIKDYIYQVRGQDDLKRGARMACSVLLSGYTYAFLASHFAGPSSSPPSSIAEWVMIGLLFSVMEAMVRAGIAMALCAGSDLDDMPGNALVEIVSLPIRAGWHGLKGFFERVVEEQRAKKKQERPL